MEQSPRARDRRRECLLSSRNEPVGSLVSSLCAKQSVKGGIYEACKKNTPLARGCHRDVPCHRDEFRTAGLGENFGSKLYNGGQRHYAGQNSASDVRRP